MSDAGGQSRSPSAPDVLSKAIEYHLEDLHTMLPGRIEEYSLAEARVSVKPLVKRRVLLEDGSELLEELPIVPDVPLVISRTTRTFLSHPVQKGDLCALIFSERSLDNWLAGQGDDADPDEFRHHDLSDAICVIGLYPFSLGLKDISDTNLVIGFDQGGLQIHITPDGTMEVKVDGAADEAVALGNALKAFWDSVVKPLFDAHVHPSGVGPTGPPTTLLPAFDTTVISNVLKVKGG